MKIGTDISIAECRNSGYMVIEFKKRELIKKGVLQKDAYVDCTQSNPECWKKGRPIIGFDFHQRYCCNTICTWNMAIEIFKRHGEGILKYIGCESEEESYLHRENPTEYDLLNLIADINSYSPLGID